MSDTILTEVQDGTCTITLNRPEVENAMNTEMLEAFDAAVAEAGEREDVLVLLIRGAGDSFSTGLDPRDRGTLAFNPAPADRPYMSDIFVDNWRRSEIWGRFSDLPKPKIATIQGKCLGDAAMLAMLCSTTIASEDAIFGDPAIRMGLSSANPLWMWTLGPRRARDVYFGRYLRADTAREWGLLTRVVPLDQLAEEGQLAADSTAKRGGMTGLDGQITGSFIGRTSTTASGKPLARDFAVNAAALSAYQRYGFRDGEYDFWKRVEELGIEDALTERDDRYAAYVT